jgi:hypothetical protein
MKWVSILRAELEQGKPLDQETALWLLRAVEWQQQQISHAFEAILDNCERSDTGPSGEEAWWHDSDADAFMNPDHPVDIGAGPPRSKT